MFNMCLLTWDELNCVCNQEHKQEYSGSQPNCSLEPPGDLLKVPMLRTYPRLTVSESWGRGTQAPAFFKAPLPRGDFNVQFSLRPTGLKLSTEELVEGTGDFRSSESDGKV